MKAYTLDQLKDKHIGEIGSQVRDQYENELKLDLLGDQTFTHCLKLSCRTVPNPTSK